jgi:very-short-patch-repair endonuclease
MLALISRHRLPRPRVNTLVEGEEVDFHWPAARLIVETDGAATHLTPTAFEQDRERDAKLTLAGYRVIRVTWRQVTAHPDRAARTIRALLAEPNGANL